MEQGGRRPRRAQGRCLRAPGPGAPAPEGPRSPRALPVPQQQRVALSSDAHPEDEDGGPPPSLEATLEATLLNSAAVGAAESTEPEPLGEDASEASAGDDPAAAPLAADDEGWAEPPRRMTRMQQLLASYDTSRQQYGALSGVETNE